MDINAAIEKAAAMADAISSKSPNADMEAGAGLPKGKGPVGEGLDVAALVAKLKSKPLYAKMSDAALEKAIEQFRSKLRGMSVDQAFQALAMGSLASTFMSVAAEEEDEEAKGEVKPSPNAMETSKDAVAELMGGR